MAVKILAADDSATMRRVLEMTFAGEAVEVTTVESGDSALERASRDRPDLVLADASMSGTDGYEVARAIKSNPNTANIAVVVLASQHHPYDAERGRAAGVDDHVLKPFDTQAMLDKARDVLGRPRAQVGATAVAAAPRPAPPAPPRPAAPAAVPAAQVSAASAPRPAGVGRPGAPTTAARSTVAFGAVQPPKPSSPTPVGPAAASRPQLDLDDEPIVPRAAPVAAPVQRSVQAAVAPVARPVAAPAPRIEPARPAAAVAAATAGDGEMAGKLAGLGLTRDQIEGVLSLSRDVIERVVWEVVPDLAETIIREELKRLTND